MSSESDWSRFPPGLGELDLVICDSLQSPTPIAYVRRLCEHYGFFSMIECEALDAPLRWALTNLRACSGKYLVGSYYDLDLSQIRRLLFKTLTVKRTVKSRSLSNVLQTNRRPTDSHDWVAELNVDEALEDQQIVPYFQPQVCMKSLRITGAEVLARWQHPQKGVLGPQIFLDLFDSPQRQHQLFRRLLQAGLQLQQQLRPVCIGEALVFSYNIEAGQLAAQGFAEQVLQQIDDAGVVRKQIALEVTERQALTLDMQSIENISVLVKGGVGLSLDDFGTGFSSLTRLAEIPFAQIKLDAGFVAHALGPKQTRIIEAIVGMARALNLELVAEGIETERQRAHLQRLGVDVAQGYLWHKPMNGKALVQLLAATHMQQLFTGQG